MSNLLIDFDICKTLKQCPMTTCVTCLWKKQAPFT